MADDQLPVPRTCGVPRKRDGQPCEATSLGADGLCSVHGGRVDPAVIGRVGAERSAEVRREQGKSVRDRLREKVEEELETVWSTFLEGLTATSSYVTKDGDVVTVPDHRTRVQAAQALLAEAYGRPPVSIEATGEPAQILFQTIALAGVVEREGGSS